MAISWDDLKDASDTDPPIVTIYGGAKLGKTTLASEFPAPYYCRTGEGERQSAGAPMKSFGVSETYGDVMDQADWMLETEHDRRTFVVDALDGMEVMINAEACARNGWADIEEPGFGKGYAAAHAIWIEFIKKMLALKKAGFYVVLISHVKAKTVPGVTTDSYPRYMLNLRDDAGSAVCDASDLIGFLHQRVSIAKEELGFKKTAKRGQGGGDVQIAVQERPGFIAGNRYQIPKAVLDYKQGSGFAALNAYFPPQPEIVTAPVLDEEEEAA
ncbi:ATP-binding protein [Rhizobium binae]|uniref:ATP-binding protein n=1 Tax=Rhizobium binae TaxID=1138190 RepID=UPI001C83B1CF|nr:ATP-binding protein [Rhizobium binae]MBX4941133.1 AAA family ATPase [Rhizobium binae]